jgi:predicted dehydrogenase
MDKGFLMQLDALGETSKTFRIDIWGKNLASSHEIVDNFSMFRRMLWHFAKSIENGLPAVPPEDTLHTMRLLMAARIARSEKRRVFLNEIQI